MYAILGYLRTRTGVRIYAVLEPPSLNWFLLGILNFLYGPSFPPSRASLFELRDVGAAILVEWLSPGFGLTCLPANILSILVDPLCQ